MNPARAATANSSASALPTAGGSRLSSAWRALDRRIATRWPGLHVTKTHDVLVVVLLFNLLLLAVAFLSARHADAVPDPDTWFSALLMLAMCASVGWLILRGLRYRLLPVARGASRASWIWLDLVSLLAINGTVLLGPTMLEWRLRALRPLATLEDDFALLNTNPRHRLEYGSGFDLAYDWYQDPQFPRVANKPNAERIPSAVRSKLCEYAPATLLGNNENFVFEDGVDLAKHHFALLCRAHTSPVPKGRTAEILVVLGSMVGLALWLASLPALTGAGLLGALALMGLGSVLAGLAGIVADSEDVGYAVAGLVVATIVAIAIWGLVRRRGSLLGRSAFGVTLLLLPLSAAVLWLWNGFMAPEAEDRFFRLCAFAILTLIVALVPLLQYGINVVHAAPD